MSEGSQSARLSRAVPTDAGLSEGEDSDTAPLEMLTKKRKVGGASSLGAEPRLARRPAGKAALKTLSRNTPSLGVYGQSLRKTFRSLVTDKSPHLCI